MAWKRFQKTIFHHQITEKEGWKEDKKEIYTISTDLGSERCVQVKHLEIVSDALQELRVAKPRPPPCPAHPVALAPGIATQHNDPMEDLVHGNGCHATRLSVVETLIEYQPQSEHAHARQPFRERYLSFLSLTVVIPANPVQSLHFYTTNDIRRFRESLLYGDGKVETAHEVGVEVLDGDLGDEGVVEEEEALAAGGVSSKLSQFPAERGDDMGT